METESHNLEQIKDQSTTVTEGRRSKSKHRHKKNGENVENGNINVEPSTSAEKVSRKLKKAKAMDSSTPSEHAHESNVSNADSYRKEYKVEVTSITDEDEINLRDETIDLDQPDSTVPDQATMVSSYTTGVGDNDVIEIHQFSPTDVDPYLEIYFETLDNRLRRHIGNDEELQTFRNSMKNRINTAHDAREYQNVLLGKINGHVVAAVTMSFHDEIPTIPLASQPNGQNSCLKSATRWMSRRANYVPKVNNECYIEMIGVKRDFRSRGIGAAMLQCIEHFARQAGATTLTIHISGAPLQQYFERSGFRVDHRDYSAFWKSIFERESSVKLVKDIPEGEENFGDYSAESYHEESIVESAEE